MKRKNRFISMSLIYSFFIVFVAISISLLAIYSSNINLVKNINKEIKSDLTDKGNKDLVVLTNLIRDGSFEETPSPWQLPAGTEISTIQRYYGLRSLHTTSAASNYVESAAITLVSGHYYYFQRIYQAPLGTNGYANLNDTPTEVLIGNKNIIRRQTARPCTGWNHITPTTTIMTDNCGNSRNMERTVEVSVFVYEGSSGSYKLQIKSSNNDLYTDGYILVDLTASLGQAKINSLPTTNRTTILANAIDKMIDSNYFEGKKIFTTYQTGL